MALSACQRNEEPQAISNGQPVPGGDPVQVQVGPTRDPSLPDASAVAVQMAADKAKEEALAQQQPPQPPSEKPLAQSSDSSTPTPNRTRVN